MPYDLGDAVPLSVSVYNSALALTNVTTISLTITLPDGTTVTPTVTNPPAVTGVYTYDYAAPVLGQYAVRWLSTGPLSAHTDMFDVRSPNPRLLFSLSDAKKTLNISSTVTKNDDEIRDLIESTTDAIEFMCGPVVRQTIVEKHDGGSSLVLRESPVISVTSIVPVLTSGTTYLMSECDLDSLTGEIIRLSGANFKGPLRVSFVAGRVPIPAAIRDGGRIILKHLWATQNGQGGLPSFLADTDMRREMASAVVPGLGYAIPNRAIELLQPFFRPPKVG